MRPIMGFLAFVLMIASAASPSFRHATAGLIVSIIRRLFGEAV